MDLLDRLQQLENNHDWQGALELLEESIANTNDSETKADFHLRLGHLLQTRFLQGVKALKHFQDAYKLNPALTSALVEARAIYWELGKLNMVQKLLELQLRGATAEESIGLLSTLGDVYANNGDFERASGAYAQALRASDGSGETDSLSDKLADAQASSKDWQDRAQSLLQAAERLDAPAKKVALFLRAARLAKRFAPTDVEGLLARAYAADPTDRETAALYEGMLVDAQRTDLILETQRDIIKKTSDLAQRSRFAFRFGARWALWHQNHELATHFIEEALKDDPGNEAGFAYLREIYGNEGGNWDRVISIADKLIDRIEDTKKAVFLLSNAAKLKWRVASDLEAARRYFKRLAEVVPGHSLVRAFEAEQGALTVEEQPAATARSVKPEAPVVASSESEESSAVEDEADAEESTQDAPQSEKSEISSREPAIESKPPQQLDVPPSSEGAEPPVSGRGDPQKISALREKLAEQEAAKRPHEAVKTLILLADELTDPSERVGLYVQAAELYATKFMNQAEASKAYERVLQIEPGHAVAMDYLCQTYEKRRDWEKLIALRKSQAERLGGSERLVIFKEIAALATERVKKPEMCIELWSVVLAEDPADSDALKALVQLYERSREYEKLADVLERLVEHTYDTPQRVQLLTKLGQIAGDRLKDDEKAANAYRLLLAMDPEDRRAQEQLKKRYLTLGRWDDLELLYAESGKWDEFIRVLETSETKTEDTAQRILMLMKIAELWMTQKGKPDRAAKSYEKILSLDEDNLDAAERLIPVYGKANNPRGLVNALEVKLRHVQDSSERLSLLGEAAALYEDRVNDKEKAFERYLSAFELTPGEEAAQANVERLAAATGKWETLTRAYRSAIDTAQKERDTSNVTALRLRLGRVLLEEIKDVEGALEQYHSVYDDEPDNAVALAALEQLYRGAERWSDLLDVYSKRLNLAQDTEQRTSILGAIADLHEQRLGKPEQAIATYRSLLDESPGNVAALTALDRLFKEAKNWDEYAQILRQRIELDVSVEQLIDLKYRLAQTEEKHLDSPAAALENYREILFLDSDHEAARLALENLLESKDLAGEAAAILEHIYEARQDWSKLVNALETLVTTSDDSTKRIALLRKIASITANQLSDLKGAFAAQARALEENPALDDCRLELEELAVRAQASDRLGALYGRIATESEDSALKRAYWLRAASIQQHLGNVDEAAKSYGKLLELDPADGDALKLMDTLYRNAARWTDLVDVFRRRIALAYEASERESLLAELAGVYEQKLNQPAEAISAYREILAFEPTSHVAQAALDTLFTAQEMWSDLAEHLETRLGLAESEPQKIEIMLRLASAREDKMGQIDGAIEGYRRVLDFDSRNATALSALERHGKEPEYELSIAEVLEPLYRQQGDFEKLIGVHEVQVRRSDDVHRRVELLHQIASLCEDAASDSNRAFDVYARALAEDPANETSRQSFDRIARLTGRFTDLAAVFEKLAGRQTDVELGSQLYMAAARALENDVGDVNRAIELYGKVLSIDSNNLAAAEALQALFQGTQRYADMSQILQRKAEMLENIEDRKAALYQAASLEEEVLGRQDSAIAVYQKVLEHDPEDIRSIDALVNLYLRLERWEKLLEVQAKKVELVLEPEEKKVIYYQMGSVFERELGDVQRAIDSYQRVLELDPDDLTALGRLDVLHQTAENWGELLGILAHEAELTADQAEAISYHYRIAELYEKHLDDVARAVEMYRDILNIQSDHTPTLQALEGIKSGTIQPLAAALVLEPIYDATGEYERLISALEVQVRYSEDAFTKVDLLHRIARLCEDNLADHARAFDTYARAVEIDSHNTDSLSALERLAMTIGRWPQVAALYDRELDKLGDMPERFVDLGLRTAHIYEVQLDNIDGAVGRFRRVLEAEPDNRNALKALDRLFMLTDRWVDLAGILALEAEIAESPDEILELKYRLGEVYERRLSDVDRAIAAYSEVLSAAPEHERTRQALEGMFEAGVKQSEIGEILEPLYQAGGEYEKLLKVHEAQLAQMRDPSDRLAMFYRLAEDCEERLGDSDRAFAVYARALRESPLDERVSSEVERLASRIDNGWERLAAEYTATREQAEASINAELGKRLARVFEEELGDIARAEECYRDVLRVAASDADSLAQLDRIYSGLERWSELAGVLEQRAVGAALEHEHVELYTRLGQVYEEKLGQVEDAVRAYREIFNRLEPTNENAISALARIYESREDWQALNEVYERQLKNAAGDVDEADIRARIAHLSADKLGRVDAAIAGWKRVLDLRGEDTEALDALGRLYEQQESWAELSDVLERRFDIAQTDEERVNALTERARLFSKQLGRDDDALETWQRVLDVDFGNLAALRAIADIWRSRENPGELVAALHATVDRASSMLDVEELKSIFRELGRNYGNVLEQPFDAAEAWTRLLEIDPANFESLAELERIYRADERWDDVVRVKMQRSTALEDSVEKVRELLEVTELWQGPLENYDGATAAFDQILKIDPGHELAFQASEELHSKAGRSEALIELYLNRLEQLTDHAERGTLLRKIARVFDEELNDKDQAFEALVNAFSEDFGDDETAAYLERVTQATEKWGVLLETANAWLAEQKEPKARIKLCLRLGKWYGEDLGHPEWAQPYYQQVMQLDPKNVQVLRQMAAIYRMGAQWQKMGETLTRALDVAVANEDRTVILCDLGELLEKHMGQTDPGISYYRRALEIDPHFAPALDALEVLYTTRDDSAELVKILSRKIEAQEGASGLEQTKLRLAELYEKRLQDWDQAARVYREVLAADGASLLALRGLERVYGTLQKWGDLVEVLERELDVVESERDRVEALLKIAKIQEEQFLKADLAAQRLEQVLEIDPSDMRAYEALERCYRRLKQWLELINTYYRHIGECVEQDKKIELYRSIAEVYSGELEDNEQAIAAYQNLVELDDANIGALEALARLYEKQGDTALGIETMTRVADLTSDGKQRVEMYYRIGRMLEERLSDRSQARDRFEQALDLDPTHVATLAALRTIAIDEADWHAAANYLEQEQEHTESVRARAKLLVELGKIRDEKLEEHDSAISAYEAALKCDEDAEEAAFPLVQEYVQNERWAEAEPLADMLVRRSKARERHEQHSLFHLQGKVAAALGNDEKALKAFQTAHGLDVTNQETIQGIAEVAFRLRDWPSALSNYQKVLTSLGDDAVEERAEVYFRLGCIKREQGQAKHAINNFEKVLALNGEHRQALEALVDVYEKAGEWKEVAAYKRQILDGIFDEDERFKLLMAIGDIWAEKQKEPKKAIEAYEEAKEIRPVDHILLHKLLQFYQEVGNWQQMVDTVESIAELETVPEKKARYFYTMAQIYRDKLEDFDRAIELFNATLDSNPELLEAFERINKILTQQKNWKQLERQYRKMLHRMAGKGKPELEYTLWHQLGLIYRDRIHEVGPAIEAFRMAASLRPEETQERLILSELYELGERYDEAIVEQRLILEKDPLSVDPYRALYRLYLHKRSYDEAWCVAAAIAFMGKAGQEEAQFVEDYRPRGMLQVKGRLSNDIWFKDLFHPELNLYISKIFEMIYPAALQAKIVQLKAQNKLPILDKKFKQDPATSTITFAKTFGWAAQVIGVQVPELYIRNDVPGSVVSVPAVPLASVAGQTVLSGFQPQELAFICGKHMASYRGELYIRNLFPTQAELTIMLFAGVALAAPNTPMPGDMAQQIRMTAQELAKYLQPVQLEGLRTVVKRFIDDGAKANIKRWNHAAELSATRVGFLLSGDLEIAKKIVNAEPATAGSPTAKEKMKDILLFCVSEQYSRLRKALGVEIAVK